MHPKLKKYLDKHPVIEIYRGYEIRQEEGHCYIVDAAFAIYSTTSTSLKACYEFIDELVNANVKQYDNESVCRYLIDRDNKKRKY